MDNVTDAKEFTFDILGEFITNIAREWFYTGEKSYENVMKVLMDCMTGTDTPDEQIRRYAEDILLGRAALKGSTADGTYHLERYEPGEEEPMLGTMNIWEEIKRRKKVEQDLARMIERWDVAMEHISESAKREIRKELGEETAEDRQQNALDSFIKRMADEEEHTTEDYGWLAPNGTFYGVEWGEHQEWARNYMDEEFPEEDKDCSFAFSASTTPFNCLIFAPSPSALLPQSSIPAVAALNSELTRRICLFASVNCFFNSLMSTLNLVVVSCSAIVSLL